MVALAQSRGVALYQRGEYEPARRALERELQSQSLTEKQRATARLYLAASLFELGDTSRTWAQLIELARSHPEQEVDPVLFPPEFVVLAGEARKRVGAERPRPPPPEPERPREEPPARPEEPVERDVQPVAPPEDPFAQGDTEPEPSGRSRFIPEVFGFLDPVGKAVGLGGGVTYGTGSFDVGARVLLGDQLGAGAQVGYVLGDGAFRPHLGLRATAIPSLSAYGGGPVVGARLGLGSSLTVLGEVGAEFFTVSEEGYRSFVVSTSVGLGFDLLSP
jgi:tetratricopeptide (TPR) repeat protein